MMTAVALLVVADLFAAIRAQDLTQVEKLLTNDPSLAAKADDKGVSPVSLAMGARKAEGFVPRKENRVLDALLRRNPPLSPFETAGLGTAEQVRALAKDPQYVRSVANNGWTPLHYAAFNDNAAAAAALLDAGADVNARAKNKFDNTPLQVSLLTSSREAARVLLARGADVNARQAEGVTALHEGAQSGDLGIIRMLLAAGADPKARSAKFGTPQDLARKGKHLAAARLLADAGARPPPAYVVAEVEVTDRATMQKYGQKVPETLAPFEGHYRYVVRGGDTQALEGEPPKGIVVIGFDSAAEARRWYDSQAYAAIKPIRQRAAKSRIFIVEGVAQ